MKKQLGATTLVITVIIVSVISLMLLYQANFNVMQQRTANNVFSERQAEQAAEAGLEYAFAYLVTNSAVVLASPTSGLINFAIGPTSLSNGASYSVTIRNPTALDYSLLNVVSTGTSADAQVTRTVRQQAFSVSNTITTSALVRGAISMVGGSTLTNTVTNMNIQAGGALTLNNGAATYTSSGLTSSQGNIKSDIQQNQSSLSSLSDSAFFQQVFGTTQQTAQTQATASGTNYNNSVSGGDYSQTLKNKTGSVIYINQSNVTLGQGVTIGSSANPVTIITTGALTIANGVTINGMVYSAGSMSLAGGARINGGIAAGGAMSISNGFQLTFREVPKLAGGGSTSYVKVAGSWRDF